MMSLCDTCPNKGSCCMGFSLFHGSSIIQYPEYSRSDVEAMLEKDNLSFFKAYRVDGETDTDPGPWVFSCEKLGEDGLCTDYENRPSVCSRYQPKTDALCALYE